MTLPQKAVLMAAVRLFRVVSDVQPRCVVRRAEIQLQSATRALLDSESE